MSYATSAYSSSAPAPNTVLRNTYGLLALTTVPTIAGALLGVGTSLGATLFGDWTGAILALVVMFGLIFGIHKTRNSGMGVALLLLLTFVMGVMLSGTLGYTLGLSNGVELVLSAFGMTSVVLVGMAVLSSVIKRNLSGLSSALFIGLLLLIGAGIVNVFVQSSALALTLAAAGAGIFSLYILVDLKDVREGRQTNYVLATLNLYLDVFNLFVHLVRLLAMLAGED